MIVPVALTPKESPASRESSCSFSAQDKRLRFSTALSLPVGLFHVLQECVHGFWPRAGPSCCAAGTMAAQSDWKPGGTRRRRERPAGGSARKPRYRHHPYAKQPAVATTYVPLRDSATATKPRNLASTASPRSAHCAVSRREALLLLSQRQAHEAKRLQTRQTRTHDRGIQARRRRSSD